MVHGRFKRLYAEFDISLVINNKTLFFLFLKGNTLKWNIKQILKNPKHFLLLVYPYLLAHHPICKYYEDHFVTVKGKKLCIGCTFLIPSFFLGVGVFLFTPLINSSFLYYINLQTLFLVSLILSASQLVPSIVKRFKKSKKIKAVLKTVSGLGFALIVYVILKTPVQSQHPLLIHLLYLFLIYYVFVFPYGFFKIRNITKTCTSCEFKGNWEICDGFRDFYRRMYEENFWIKDSFQK